MAAIAFNPTLALPARVTLAKGRSRSVAVRASARPAGSRAASKNDAEAGTPLAMSDASDSKGLALAALPLLTALALPEAAEAAVNPVASAFAAYGHYLGLVLVVASLTTEKFLVKPELTEDEAQKLVIADSVYGIAGVLVLYTGYLRVTQYGKGWEYYAHEPIFWVKMGLFAVMGSSSLFCTTKIVQMAVKKTNGEENATVLGEKLSARMQKIINGELLAIGSIPLAAALMARGVAYAENMPWQAGAAPVALVSLGLSVKYVKEALTWTDEPAKEKVEA
jgi:putative membrane protein